MYQASYKKFNIMQKRITSFLLLLFISLTLNAQSNDATTKHDNIDALMQHCYDNGLFNGTIMVTQNGETIYKNAFGFADKAANRALTNESAFYLCSVSKQFTTMAVMILKEQGKLDYDDTLSKYFPQYPDYADTVTIKHLMTHTSGVPDHYNLGAYKVGLNNQDVLELLVKQEKLNFSPGEKYQYSNGGYVMLAMIVEKVAGMPFHTFMDAAVFEPLGMNNTLVFDESSPTVDDRAVGYNMTGDLDDYEIFTTGAGGIYSNIADLHLWDQSLYTEKLISKATLNEAFTPTTLNSGEISNYGYGWGISENEGAKSIQHSGSLSGYRTYIKRNLYDNSGYILLTNNGAAFKSGGIRQALDNILKNEAYELPKIPISSKLAVALKINDANTAINDIQTILKDDPDSYEIDEQGINTLGYNYLNDKKINTVLAIFKFNVDLNPSAFNVYDSLGEALLVKGDSINAIENYKKSYRLNRNNINAITVLNGIGVDTNDLTADIVVPVEILESYVGKYELNPNFVFSITREKSQLFIQATGQSVSGIFASSQERFYSKVVSAQITFNKDENGKVTSLTLHQNGDHLAKRLE